MCCVDAVDFDLGEVDVVGGDGVAVDELLYLLHWGWLLVLD